MVDSSGQVSHAGRPRMPGRLVRPAEARLALGVLATRQITGRAYQG
jgi:hypothetical protein